ncbi:hypothetical protein PBY51_007546 [Eleginops maclovinus]|uniref:Uncharacterized protein n=1 Tax=Eleginops maclovinus TaxID=56733 RepID=A0AAN8ADJ7_ELEMC|nr:hypothetical protein PBY51_007546 [Eleginops maclovinus]
MGPVGEGMRFLHHPTHRPSPHRVYLGQPSRDGQPAIITTQTGKKEEANSEKVLEWRGGVDSEEEAKVLSSCSPSGRATGSDVPPMGIWSFLPLTHPHSRIPESKGTHNKRVVEY